MENLMYGYIFFDILGGVKYGGNFVFCKLCCFADWNLNLKIFFKVIILHIMSKLKSTPNVLKFDMHLVHKNLRPLMKR